MSVQQSLDLEHKFLDELVWKLPFAPEHSPHPPTHTQRAFGKDDGWFPPPVAPLASFLEWGQKEGHPAGRLWVSLPAPDNFTTPTLAGGDNHIRLPWQDALNSPPVPLNRLTSSRLCNNPADATLRRFVFNVFFYSARFKCKMPRCWGR